MSTYITSFPETISEEVKDVQVNKLTDIVVNSATEFFGMTVASKKKRKGWWSKDINKARKPAKNAQLIYKKGKLQQTCNTLISKKYFSKI